MVEPLTQGDIDALTIRSSRLLRKKRGGIRNFGSVPIGCIPSRVLLIVRLFYRRDSNILAI